MFDFQTFSLEAQAFWNWDNIDLEATIVEVKIHIYMAHFYFIWIEHWVILSHGSLVPPKKSKLMG